MSVKIKIRRSTSVEWAASLSILDQGELGLDTTLNKLKAGNGINLWSALPFINILPSELSELAQDAVEAAITAGIGITKSYNDTANTITLAIDSTVANKTYVDTAVAGLGNTSATTYVPLNLLGQVDGVAELDANGFVPDTQIPAGITRDTELSSSITTEVTNRNLAISTAKAEAIADATSQINALIVGAPAALNTLDELAAALNDDASYAATITTALGFKAPLASPTFTGTVTGIDKTMVGLANVDNTSDANKPVSTATQTALDLKSNISDVSSPKTVSGASYTLELTDSTKTIVTTATSGDVTITVPTNSSVNFPLGSTITLFQSAAGRIIVAPANGVTLKSVGDFAAFKNRFSFSFITLYQYAANSWAVVGDLTA